MNDPYEWYARNLVKCSLQTVDPNLWLKDQVQLAHLCFFWGGQLGVF